MAIYFPQSYEAVAELRELMIVSKQLVSAQKSQPCTKLIQVSTFVRTIR